MRIAQIDINFKVRKKSEASGGLIMDLIPGEYGDAAAMENRICIAEDAFAFIEDCIATCWPKYANYGHWGLSAIPAEVWVDIVQQMQGLAAKLREAKDASVMDDAVFFSEDVRDELRHNFDHTRNSVVLMIEEIIVWINASLKTCAIITIAGI